LAESSGVPLPLLWVGLFLAYFLIFFGYQNLTGGMTGLRIDERPFWNDPWGFAEFFIAGLLAWVPAYVILVRRSARRNLDALRPSLNAQPSDQEWFGPASARYYRVAGASGVGFALAADGWYFSGVIDQQLPEAWEAWVAWTFVRDAAGGWFMWQAWAVALSVAIHFHRLADLSAAVQLLNLRALSPFARQGFRLALLFCIGIAIISPVVGLIPIEQAEPFSSVAPLILAALLFAGVLLYLPCAGAYRAIAKEKSAELERVRAEIERQRGIALSADHGSKTAAASELPGLLAYEARVEKVRGWPFGAVGLLRFLLYVAIPVGSWVAAAVVERLVSSALD
jgi:hypothetical protein